MQEDLRLLCTDGCKQWTLENAQSDECTTGKSASNAMVARQNFVESDAYNSLLAAMGLGSETSSAGLDDDLTDESNLGLWSSGTQRLIKLPDPKIAENFETQFFSAYENFRTIRNSDVSTNCPV